MYPHSYQNCLEVPSHHHYLNGVSRILSCRSVPLVTQPRLSEYPGNSRTSLIVRFMGPTWGPLGADRAHMGPMVATWTLLSGMVNYCCEISLLVILQCYPLQPSRPNPAYDIQHRCLTGYKHTIWCQIVQPIYFRVYLFKIQLIIRFALILLAAISLL